MNIIDHFKLDKTGTRKRIYNRGSLACVETVRSRFAPEQIAEEHAYVCTLSYKFFCPPELFSESIGHAQRAVRLSLYEELAVEIHKLEREILDGGSIATQLDIISKIRKEIGII